MHDFEKGLLPQILGRLSFVAPLPPDAAQIDSVEDHHQIRCLDLDALLRLLCRSRGREAEAPSLQSLDVGITRPSFLVRYTIFVRSVC
jgi:hypothetical protein